MTKTKVSYLVALYNKEKYIEQCIDSVLAEVGPHIDIEVCVVDDGSTDRSAEIVRTMYSGNSRVLFHEFRKNHGKNAAYNKAYALSTGEYIAILGADDFIPEGRTIALLEGLEESAVAVYGDILIYNDQSGTVHGKIIQSVCKYPEILLTNTLSGGACLFPRKLGGSVFPIPEHLKFEDWWVAFSLLKVGNISLIGRPVLYYRIHNDNDVGALERDYKAVYKDYSRHMEYLAEFQNHVYDPEGRKYLSKSEAMRKAFFGEYCFRYLLLLPLDFTWLKTVYFMLFGAKSYYLIKKLFK